MVLLFTLFFRQFMLKLEDSVLNIGESLDFGGELGEASRELRLELVLGLDMQLVVPRQVDDSHLVVLGGLAQL
jgi:hypothetical protein